MTPTDDALVHRARLGDREAVGRLAERYLVNVGLLFPALGQLIDSGLIPPFPDACFADRGPFIYEKRVFDG